MNKENKNKKIVSIKSGFIPISILVSAFAVIISVGFTFGLSKIMNIDNNPAALIAQLFEESTPTPTPILSPSATPEPSESPVGPVSTPSPTPRPTLKLTPTPTPTPTPPPTPTPLPPPAHCSIQLTYKLGNVDVRLFELGYSRQRLNELLGYAEKQWEDALGIDLFNNYQGTINTVNFILDPAFKFKNGEDYDYTDVSYQKIYSNGTAEHFTVNIYTALFDYAVGPNNVYLGSSADEGKLMESALIREMMHSFGHALGLANLKTEEAFKSNSVMLSGKWLVSSYWPKLFQEDINYAEDFCKNN